MRIANLAIFAALREEKILNLLSGLKSFLKALQEKKDGNRVGEAQSRRPASL